MNEEKLKRFYDNSIKHFDLPDFNTFKSEMQDDSNLARLRKNMLPYYDLPELEVMKTDFFSGGLTGKSGKGKTTESVEVTEVDEEPTEEQAEETKKSINYQKEKEVIDKAEQVVKLRLMRNDTISDEEKAKKLKKLEEFNAKKRAKLDEDVQDDFASKLFEITNTGASDEMVEQWTEEVTTPAPQIDTPFFGAIPKASITAPYEAFLESAEKSLKDQGKDPGKEDVKEMAIKMAIADKNTKWKAGQTAEVMEQVETDFGIDRTDTSISQIFSDIGSAVSSTFDIMTEEGRNKFISNLSEEDKKRIQEQGAWSSAAMQANAVFGGKQGKEYYDARIKIYDKLEVKQKELEKEYASQVNNIVSRGDNIKKEIESINSYEEKFKNLQEKGEKVSDQEYSDYARLFEKVKVDRALYQKDIDDLGSKAIPSNDYDTIKNLTLKTYDNLEMVNNNVLSSVMTVGAGVGTLVHELTLPEMIKWSGLDIESEEGLTKIFGEEESTIKELARNQGKANLSMSNALDSAHQMGNAIKGQNAPVPSIGEVDSLGDFGMYMMDLASGQMVNTALTVAFPPAGLLVLAGSAAGGKMYEMNKEMEGVEWTAEELADMKESGVTPPDSKYKVPPVNYNALEYFGTGAMVGGAEYLTEKVSLGILKGGFKNVQKAFDLSGDGINATLKQMTTPKQLAKLGYNFGKDSFKEAGAEGIVQLTSNFADRVVLGKEDVSIMDGMTDSMAAGFFMGNMFSGPPAIASMVTTAFSSEAEFAQANKLNAQMISLSKQRDAILAKDPRDRDGAAGMLQSQIEETLDKQMESMNKVRQRTLDMTGSDRQGMIDQYNKEHKLRSEIDKINENPDISKENKAIMVNGRLDGIAKSEAIRSRILSDATFNADIKRQSDLSTKIRTENGTLDMVEYVVADNSKSALDQGLDKIDAMDLTDQQKSALKDNLTTEFNAIKEKSANGESYNGFAWGDNIEIETQKDGKMVKETLNVPMTFALNKNNATVASHELGHQTMYKQFIKNNPRAVELVDELESYVKNNYKKAYDNFKAVRAAYESEGLSKEQMAEEQLANLSDFMRMNNLQGDRTLHNKLFGRFQKVNDGNNQIETGKDVFDMLTSYNQSFETGQLQGLAKSIIKGDAKVKAKDQAETTTAKDEKSKTAFSKDVNPKQVQTMVDKVANRAWSKFGKPIPANVKQKAGVTRQSYIESAKTELQQIAKEFDPKRKDKDGNPIDFNRFMANRGMQRMNSLASRLGVESAEKPTSKRLGQAVKEGEKEFDIKSEDATPEEAMISKEVGTETRKGIKLAERLGDDAKKISDKVKKMKPVLEGKTYKTLKDLAPDDTQRMFGITPKPGNLTKADVKNAQAFIRKNADILLAMLPEGTTISGKSTGLQKVLLDPFYNKGRRVKAAKTGSTQGLATQNKKPNIKASEFLEVFGITPAGQPNVSDRNTSARIKALVDQTGKLLTNQAVREAMPDAPVEITEGKSRVMFSKNAVKPKTKGVKENIKYIQEQAGIRPLETKGEGRIESVSYLLNEFFPKLIEEFGDSAQFLLKSSTISPSGNEGVSFNQDGSIKKTGGAIGRDQLFINSINKTLKSKPETQKLIDEGKLGQLQDILDLFKSKDLKSNTKIDSIKTATLPQKTPNLQRNIDSRSKHKEGSKAILNSLKNMYDSNNNSLSGIAFMLYNANANSAMYRNLAQLIGVEIGSGKNNAREEHIYQAGPWAQRTLQAITKDKKIFDAFNKWQAENYYQETITKDSERLVDGKYKLEDGSIYDAKSQEHPYMKEQMDIAMKTGDFSNVPSPDLRKYNEHFHLNPNNIIREGISDAKRYNVEVPNNLINNPDIVSLQARLIYEQIIGKIDAKTAKAELDIALPVEVSKNKTNQKVNVPLVDSPKVMDTKDSENMTSEDVLNKAASLDEALRNARNPNAPVKKIRVFDFDDTLARTKSNVLYTMPSESIVYNASPKSFDKLGQRTGLTFLATDIKEAQAYAENNRGNVKEITVNDNALANEQYVLNKLKELDIDITEGLLYEMIDSRFEDYYIGKEKVEQLKKELAKDGFKGFRYEDGSQISSKGTESIAIFDKSSIKPTEKLTAEEFAKKGDEILADGAEFDFSEFNKVIDGKKGPLFEVAKKIQEARGADDIFVLTARSQEASPAIKEFLDAIGLNIPAQNISGLGNSSPFAKSNWIVDKAAEGYNDFYFADDATQNVKAVRDALEVLDVKSKTQQAKIKFSKDLNMEFNEIIEQSKGIDKFKIYSDVKAQLAGARKGRGKFFIPPSAEDFQGLLYAMLGKGKQGTEQMKFFDEALNKPYARAMENLATDRVNLMADFKALKKQLEVPRDLRKKTKSGFTNEQAVRVYLWAKTGQEIPGLSKKDFKELNDIVENDPKLKVFANQLLSITKGDGYSTPKAEWQLGTLTTDLIDVLNTNKRSKYLQEWQANVDTIFSKDNMNKLEAALGPKYVEALRNSLARMKAGRNRIAGGNRLSNQVLDYINQSTGVTMFFNARSALLQTISAANFINWSFNNPLNAGKAFANQPQYWKDFTMLMNSDYLVDRRNGLKLNISESEIADAAKTSKNKAKAVLNYILEKGYIPTKYADSFAIASGGAMFYRNRVNNLLKKGMSRADAEAQAMEEFKATSEVSQQSSDPSKISQQQSGDMGRIILQYVNTPMQYVRVQKRDMQDIINRRPMPGKTLAQSNRTRLSRITYYAFLQNMLFNALQQGLFAMGFGDDDEEMSESDEKRIFNTANGMMDSWLRGLGFAGVTVQVLKNLGINIYDRSQRDRPEYSDAWQKLLEFSPAIKSKLSKLRSAGYPFDSKKRREEVFEKGFSLDNPAYESLAKVITATTNIPLDRLFSKINNIKGALEDDQETWKSVAMLLGWPEWQLEDKEDSKPKTPEEKAVAKEDKKEARYKEAVGSTDYDTIKNLTAPQQIKLMKSLGIDSDTIKKAKSEDAKIKLIIKKHSGEEPTEEEKKEIAKQQKFDGYKALTKKDQVDKLLELGLTKAQIRALKYEKDRVNKLIELEK